jgi:hypothetical protein
MRNKRKTNRQPKVKEPVRLRFKPLKDGSQSIYLDIYDNRQRSYEFLKMYKVSVHSPADKARNSETLEQAEVIKAQRILDLQAAAHGLSNTGTRKQKMLLCVFVKHLIDKKHDVRTGSHLNYQTLYFHLLNYAPNVTIKQATSKEFCAAFIEYL